jgi:hypothetical protein
MSNIGNIPTPVPSRYTRRDLLIALIAGIIYGIMARLIFGARFLDGILSTLSYGFLFIVPFALGALSVYLAPPQVRSSWIASIGWPILPGLIFLFAVALLALEAFICIIMASPVFLVATGIGGFVMCLLLKLVRGRQGKSQTYALVVLMLAPYIAGPIEQQFSVQDSVRTVHTQITIHASEAVVWRNIIRVPRIADQEQHFSLFHLAGLPKPVEATLSLEGVGGVRVATFDNGLTFVETVTAWEDLKQISFKIKVDRQRAVAAPFDAIGSKVFDVLDGTYTLEPVGNGSVILHLTSTERVSTHFNFYSGWWTDTIMADLQNYILEIVRHRAESA